jgi:hypothetical protein
MANIELLDLALKDIDNGAFRWSQETWISLPFPVRLRSQWATLFEVTEPPCGTAMCLAGHVAWQAGYRPVWNESTRWALSKDGKSRDVAEIAAELLELDVDVAEWLFHGSNDRADLQLIRDRIASGEPPLL